MKKLKSIFDFALILFASLFINFGLLSFGSLWTDPGTLSEWYESINKAPWTPSGWVFGVSWSTITICLSVLVAILYKIKENKYTSLIGLSWLLNIMWNPLFFYLHLTSAAAVVIASLIGVIFVLTDRIRIDYGWKYAWLLLPYFVWLNIALSLNLYVTIMN